MVERLLQTAIPATILVVDDDRINADMLTRRLRRLGYRVETCSEGIQACRQLEAQEFDLVLLDVMMPGMSGLDVLCCIRQARTITELPVIMVTACDTSDDIVRALEFGANDYITKPVDFPVATARIHTHLLLRQTVIALAKANREIESMALHDELTRLANRRCFNERLCADVKMASRLHSPLTLIMADVNKFKRVNDTYGHQAGDRALQEVAEFLSAQVQRETDLVARLGGDEFILLLPGTDAQGAEYLLTDMRRRMATLIVPLREKNDSINITLSLGSVTSYPSADTDPYALMRSADQAMYADKMHGVAAPVPVTIA